MAPVLLGCGALSGETGSGAIEVAVGGMTGLRADVDEGVLRKVLGEVREFARERAAAIYTLIEAAKLNGVEPLTYLTEVITRITDHSASGTVNALYQTQSRLDDAASPLSHEREGQLFERLLREQYDNAKLILANADMWTANRFSV